MDKAQRVEGEAKRPELGDLLIEHLERMGVEFIFGVPGGSIEPLYDAMARSARRGGLRPILARHEAGAAFMADGYARETGKLGVCCSTTGPGATNLITGVASAFADHVPLLVITAQTALHTFGKRVLQESSCTAVNTVAMFHSCTRYSSLVSHREQLERKLAAAILATQGPPCGPAHLSIPMDILCEPRRLHAREDAPAPPPLSAFLENQFLTDLQALERLHGEIEKAGRIALIIGSGCGEGIREVIEFAERVGAPIVSCPSGKRWINPYHPQYMGVVGFAGHASAGAVLKDERIDLIIAAGVRLGDLAFNAGESDVALRRRLIHIDESPVHFTGSPWGRLHVCGRMSAIFRNLLDRTRQPRPPNGLVEWPGRAGRSPANTPAQITLNHPEKLLTDALPIKPQRLMGELAKRFPETTRFIVDAGNSWAWATHYLFARSSGLYRVGMGFGSMAWGIGAAVGTAMGCPGKPVVCLTGDGSFLMGSQEITVAVVEKLPVIFVVLNDQALGMVKHGQRLGGGEPVAHDLPPVDFSLMARAMGARGETVRTFQDLEKLDFAEICRRPGPTLLNIHIDPEEVPPMGARMKTLGR